MVAKVNLFHACHDHDLVPTWQPSQSIGGSTMHQVLLPTGGCSIFGHLILWPTRFTSDLVGHKLTRTSASIEKINACMDPNLQLQTALPSTFSEIALNEKGGNHFFFTRDSAFWKAVTL